MTKPLDESGWPDESGDTLPDPDSDRGLKLPDSPPDVQLRDDDAPPEPPQREPASDLLESEPPLQVPSHLLDSEPLTADSDDLLLESEPELRRDPPLTGDSDDLLLGSEPELRRGPEAETVEESCGPPARLVDVIRAGPNEAYRASGSVLGPYVVEAEVARGGMGAVYRAHHETLAGRRVALKVLLAGAGASPRQRQRFLREATVGSKLLHPGIVRVHDYGEEAGVPWLALEFVEGPTLRDRIGELTVNALVELLAKACRALEVAHDAGVVHRDLKPANILIRPGGAPALTDFGLARDLSTHSSITKDGMALGTPFYMAPEQTRGKTPSPATDVFAVGVLLYQGLTGKLPFEGKTVADLYGAINTTDPPLPSRVSPERAPPLLDHVVRCALEKDPRKRYPHAGKLARDLERFLEGTLRPPPASVRPPLVALSAVVVVLLGVVVAGWWRATDRDPSPGVVADVTTQGEVGPPPLPFEPPRLPRPVDPLPTEASAAERVSVERDAWAVATGLSLERARSQVAALSKRGLAAVAIHANPSARRARLSIVWRRLPSGRTAETRFDLDATAFGREHEARPGARLAALAVHGVYPRERYAATWIVGAKLPATSVRLHVDPRAWERVARRQAGRLATLCATRGPHARVAAVWVADGSQGEARVGLSQGRWSTELVSRSRRGQRLIGSARMRLHNGVRYAGLWTEDGRGALTFVGRTASEQQLIAQVAGSFGYRPVWLAESGTRGRIVSAWVRATDRTWRGAGPAVPSPFSPLEAEVRAFMEKHDVGAAALAITRGGRLALARGYAYGPADAAPVGPRSRFRIGQAAQPLLAVTALRLAGEGRLRLDQTLGQLFPELRRPGPQQATDPRLAGVSVRRLLLHRGGWERYRTPKRFHPALGYPLIDPTFGFDREVLGGLRARGPLTAGHVFRYAIKQPLEYAPGTAHHQVAIGYVVLGRAIERVTGRDLRAVLKKEVLVPLSASDFAPAGAGLGERVRGEVLYQGSLVAVPMRGAVTRLGPRQYGGFTPAAADGWVTSAVDLARFVSSFSGRSLLTAQGVRECWRPQADAAYGMGWHVESGVVWASGRLPGSFAHVRRRSDGTGVVLLLNADVSGIDLVQRIGIHLSRIADRDWPSQDLFR